MTANGYKQPCIDPGSSVVVRFRCKLAKGHGFEHILDVWNFLDHFSPTL